MNSKIFYLAVGLILTNTSLGIASEINYAAEDQQATQRATQQAEVQPPADMAPPAQVEALRNERPPTLAPTDEAPPLPQIEKEEAPEGVATHLPRKKHAKKHLASQKKHRKVMIAKHNGKKKKSKHDKSYARHSHKKPMRRIASTKNRKVASLPPDQFERKFF